MKRALAKSLRNADAAAHASAAMPKFPTFTRALTTANNLPQRPEVKKHAQRAPSLTQASRSLGSASAPARFDTDRVNLLCLPASTDPRSQTNNDCSIQEAITRLLYSIASKKEVERYLRIFSTANKFAVIKVGGAILTCASPYRHTVCLCFYLLTYTNVCIQQRQP